MDNQEKILDKIKVLLERYDLEFILEEMGLEDDEVLAYLILNFHAEMPEHLL